MRTHRRHTGSPRGFTLIELLIALVIMMALALFTAPELFRAMHRQRLEGAARQTAILLRAARFEAIKLGCYGVVAIDPASRQVIAFVDRDRDGVYEPGNVPPEKLIGRVDLPSRIRFKDEGSNVDLGSVSGFNNPDTPVALADGQAMYQSDGSVLSVGALRFSDERGNTLEVRVAPRTSGEVEVRKFEGGTWFTNGEGGRSWTFL